MAADEYRVCFRVNLMTAWYGDCAWRVRQVACSTYSCRRVAWWRHCDTASSSQWHLQLLPASASTW